MELPISPRGNRSDTTPPRLRSCPSNPVVDSVVARLLDKDLQCVKLDFILLKCPYACEGVLPGLERHTLH